jgi:phosphoribosylformimino-5-aminoimidazole carboxamide ribotide isomerase
MYIVPVMDLKDGLVVRAVAGRRHEYRPVRSQLTDSPRPLDVARAFRDLFGLDLFYLADLDALEGAAPALETYGALRAEQFRLWVDAGVRETADALRIASAGVEAVVLGLETVNGPEVLAPACRELGTERVVFSLDLKDGTPLGHGTAWDEGDAETIAARAVAIGLTRLIVLDLARVGGGAGTATEELCARLSAQHPHVEIVAGGGVRGVGDLQRLREVGVQGALVASAFHDGQIRPEEIQALGP